MRLTILLMSLTLAACTSSATIEQVRDRDWTLVWVEEFPSIPGGAGAPTIRFGSDGRFAGNTGCNSAGAAYSADGDRLTIESMMVTKRACMAAERNQLERAFMRAVGATKRFRIVNGELELLSENGTATARFR